MADEIKIEDLQRKQEEMLQLAVQIQQERDSERMLRIASELTARGREIEQMAADFALQEQAKGGAPALGSTEVVLTPDQRQRILAATGVEMQSVVLRDETGTLVGIMPHADPRWVEQQALEEARRRKLRVDADAMVQAELGKLLGVLRSSGPAVAQKLEELQKDPSFLGGLLKKQ